MAENQKPKKVVTGKSQLKNSIDTVDEQSNKLNNELNSQFVQLKKLHNELNKVGFQASEHLVVRYATQLALTSEMLNKAIDSDKLDIQKCRDYSRQLKQLTEFPMSPDETKKEDAESIKSYSADQIQPLRSKPSADIQIDVNEAIFHMLNRTKLEKLKEAALEDDLISPQIISLIEVITADAGLDSKQVIDQGVILLDIAIKARENGLRLMLIDENENPVTEIVDFGREQGE